MAEKLRVPLNEKAVKEHLDSRIRYWREQRDKAQEDRMHLYATIYTDAYQSLRETLIGSALPREKKVAKQALAWSAGPKEEKV